MIEIIVVMLLVFGSIDYNRQQKLEEAERRVIEVEAVMQLRQEVRDIIERDKGE